ncbi:MAG: DnaJ domain-containing protein [Pyrinomonadaceae bacterium]
MTPQKPLEIKGSLSTNHLPDLLAEFANAKISGSLRLASGEVKVVIYFDQGNLVFAVSNARRHRLFEILLTQGAIDKAALAGIDGFTNDLHLAKTLTESGNFPKEAIDSVFAFQFLTILNEVRGWRDGDWSFSAAARIKADLHFRFDLRAYLLDCFERTTDAERCLKIDDAREQFSLENEADFGLYQLTNEEGYVISRLAAEKQGLSDLIQLSGVPDAYLRPILYKLWLMGLIARFGYANAIPHEILERLRSSEFQLKKSAKDYEEERAKQLAAEEESRRLAEEEKARAVATSGELSLEQYLDNIENAATHYEIFGVAPEAKLSEIKHSYFSLAKRFHPDLFHRQVDPETESRIQGAFTELAQAYETLRDPESREVYDFKLRKVIEQMRESQSGEGAELTKDDLDVTSHDKMARDNFDSGYDYLLKDNFKMALPHLARAVHLDANNARYRAFYGKALSFEAESYRKAEGELQAAIKLEPKNANYRLMLAELLVDIGHTVRAKGELNRLLKFFPNNKEALALLDSLEDKN